MESKRSPDDFSRCLGSSTKKPDLVDFFLTSVILTELFSEFLSLDDISRFDVAICNKKRRLLFYEILKSECCVFLGDNDRNISPKGIYWLKTKSISIQHLRCTRITNRLAAMIGMHVHVYVYITKC
jgi:hypothetical protein